MAPTETLAEQHAATLDRLLGAERDPLRAADRARRRRRPASRPSTNSPAASWDSIAGHPRADRARRSTSPGSASAWSTSSTASGSSSGGRSTPRAPEGLAPHVLHMTATPIPRTLSLTAYGDLDTTALRELPAGRQPVETWLVGEGEREAAYELIRAQLREGRQAFVVCPLVAESEKTAGQGGGGRGGAAARRASCAASESASCTARCPRPRRRAAMARLRRRGRPRSWSRPR